MSKTRVLTGITTSGTPHLGNYAGAIRPAILSSQDANVDAFFFLADYHALIKCDDPQRVADSRRQIAATWLAAGLNPETVTFYRQSDLPEIPELSWILTCMTPKGLMNRAHAYKAMVDKNLEKQEEPDDGVTMGLFSYPVLMAADILLFKAHKVPVGRDQIQHLEMARDIAQRFNHHYGQGQDYFVLPEVLLDDNVATLPGLDGRKMSKSYNNTIPLFEGSDKDLKNAIARIQTDSKAPGEAKEPDDSAIFLLYKAFAKPEQSQAFAQQLREGMAWGEAKQQLYSLLQHMIAPMRERYMDLMQRPDDLEDILLAGAQKARRIATPFMAQIREAVGLVRSNSMVTQGARASAEPSGKDKTNKSKKTARFISFRDEAGQFMFRLLDAHGQEILRSVPFDQPKTAGQWIKTLQNSAIDDYLIATDDLTQAGLQFQQQKIASAIDAHQYSSVQAWQEDLKQQLASFSED
ncbi:tryptophan--tRNA ligase [Brackiella oedipodis]|uniref:tryptophan--tRNA ligase n=1 Tax=Brackiella oedipodis TaxID=124225 RepID=UPI000AC90DD5|nr:tryptophan--tRNA ligase [Brackiella oedipodis]